MTAAAAFVPSLQRIARLEERRAVEQAFANNQC